MKLTRREKLTLKLIQWLRGRLTNDPDSGRVLWIRYAGMYKGSTAIMGRMSLHYGPDIGPENEVAAIELTPQMFGYTVRGMDEVQRGLWGVAGLDAEPESQRTEDGVDVVAIINTPTARLLARGHVSSDEVELWNVDRDPSVPHPVSLKVAHIHSKLAQKLYSNLGLWDDWDEEDDEEN